MADSQSELEFTEKELKVSEIRLDPALQPRLQIDQQAVREYAEDMERDGLEAFPTVTIFDDGSDLLLVDGFHRLIAAKSRNHQTIHCRVYSGTRAEARWFACGCNRDHGLRRTTADKKRAVVCALQCDPDKSNAELARHVGVSDKTVAKYRRELSATSEIPESTRRLGGDGRLVNTTNIGKRSKRSAKNDIGRQQSQAEISGVLANGTWDQLRDWLQRRIQEQGRETVWSQLRCVLQTLDFSVESIAENSTVIAGKAIVAKESEEQAKGSSGSQRPEATVVQDWVSVEL